MNKKILAGAAASAALIGGLAFAAPSLAATDSAEATTTSQADCDKGSLGKHNHVSLEASVTSIPSEVAELRDVARGAYFTAYALDTAILPSTQPTKDGKLVRIRPERAEDGGVTVPKVSAGSLTGDLRLRVNQAEGISYYALYPSDGSAPVLVTVVVDADGKATAAPSANLTVEYSAEVAATPAELGHKGKHRGYGEGKGHRGMRGGHATGTETTPNA